MDLRKTIITVLTLGLPAAMIIPHNVEAGYWYRSCNHTDVQTGDTIFLGIIQAHLDCNVVFANEIEAHHNQGNSPDGLKHLSPDDCIVETSTFQEDICLFNHPDCGI